jgi:hypothetical protein
MPRIKRNLADEDIRPVTLKLRASVHDKILLMAGPSGSKVGVVEDMVEYLFARRLRRKMRISNTMNDSSC